MPEQLFYQLDEDKRKLIFQAALREFSVGPYNAASTNNIVKAAGISKGSLFKYFKNKEDLYFYILDAVIGDLLGEMKIEPSILKGDIFEVIIRYAEIEFNWHIHNQDQYRLITWAFMKDNSVMYQKTIDRYKVAGDSIYYNLLKDIDTERLRWGKEKSADIIKWLIEGFNNDFRKKMDSFDDVSIMKNMYIKEIKGYLEMIKEGLYK